MKHLNFMVVGTLSIGLLSACNFGGGESSNKHENDSLKMSVSETPSYVDVEQTICDTFKVGTSEYIISLHRFPDSSVPLLVDGGNHQYFDNSVDLKIISGVNEVFSQRLSKDIFKEYLSPEDFQSEPFYGMNFYADKSSAHVLYFTAQVGWAGDGPAFYVKLDLQSKNLSIERDHTMVEVDYEPIETNNNK